jgi:hypothetical protein
LVLVDEMDKVEINEFWVKVEIMNEEVGKKVI